MPLALLLQSTFRPLTDRERGVARLSIWEEVGDRLAVVAERLQSMWLVSWWGPGVPLHGNALKVAFVNQDALVDRVNTVRARQQRSDVTAGLGFETVAGWGGQFYGLLALGPLATVIVGPFALVVVGVLKIWALITGAPDAPAQGTHSAKGPNFFVGIDRFYQGIVRVAGPFEAFWRQVTGPRDEVRNPILRLVLVAADHFAKLLPQLIGAIAFIAARAGPVLVPVVHATLAAVDFVKAVARIAVDAFHSLLDPIMELFMPKEGVSVVTVLVEGVSGAFVSLIELLPKAFDQGADALGKVGNIAKDVFVADFDAVKSGFTAATTDHPFVTALATAFQLLGDWIGAALKQLVYVLGKIALSNAGNALFGVPIGGALLTGPTIAVPPPPSTSFLKRWWASLPFPTPPALRPLSAITTGAFDRSGMPPNPLDLDPAAAAALHHRPSVFGADIAETRRRWEQTEAVRREALRVLPAIRGLVPAESQEYVATVARMLGAARDETPAGPQTPVRSLQPGWLSARIRNLTVRTTDRDGQPKAREFVASLRAAMDASPIFVQVVTP